MNHPSCLRLVDVILMILKNLDGFLNFEITRWVTLRDLKIIQSFLGHTLTNYIISDYHVIHNGHVIFHV